MRRKLMTTRRMYICKNLIGRFKFLGAAASKNTHPGPTNLTPLLIFYK
jgi:hypothetical protein